MTALQRFLRTLLVLFPTTVLAALLRLIALVLLVAPVLLVKLLEWLRAVARSPNLYPEKTEEPCDKLPESLVRRPDPCIYSQAYLDAQGLPVTWNNPDIWVARADNPGAIEPDSYHLTADTDYVVSVRVHNAGTDLALGVRVRLVYRPWSFNSPDVTPVQTDALGNEVYRFVDVMPMSSTVTQFLWHTPALKPEEPPAHYCLLVLLYHPMDTNIGNNVGQENTDVYSASPASVQPGEAFTVAVPLFNRAKGAQGFRFEATAYEVEPKDRVQLKLKVTRAYARWSLSQRLANFAPVLTVEPRETPEGAAAWLNPVRLRWEVRPRLVLVKSRYDGFEEYRNTLLGRDYSLPAGLILQADGGPLTKGPFLKPGAGAHGGVRRRSPGRRAAGLADLSELDCQDRPRSTRGRSDRDPERRGSTVACPVI